MTLKAVVFDCDGTLLNSVQLFYDAHVHAARQHGGTPPSREAFGTIAKQGRSLPQMFEDMQPGKDHKAMLAANGEYLVAHMNEAPAFAHLHDMLKSLHDKGLKLALLTGGNSRVYDLLRHHGIMDHFSSIVHAERTHHPKPDPEGFLLAVSECGVRPEEAVMVGDTIADIGVGKNSGALATIGITHGVSTRDQLQDAGATYIVDDLMELLSLTTSLMHAA